MVEENVKTLVQNIMRFKAILISYGAKNNSGVTPEMRNRAKENYIDALVELSTYYSSDTFQDLKTGEWIQFTLFSRRLKERGYWLDTGNDIVFGVIERLQKSHPELKL